MTSMISDYPKRVPPVVADFNWYYGTQPHFLPHSYKLAVLGDSPISYWRLDEQSGTNAVDQKATNAGTYSVAVGGGSGITTATSLLTSDLDAATAFTSSRYVDFGNPTAFQLSVGSIECLTQTSQVPDGSYHGIMIKDSAFGLFLIQTTGTLGCYDWGANANRDSGKSISDGQPHHIMMSFRSGITNGTIIYLDGQPVLTTTITVSNQASPLRVASSSASQSLSGTFDEPAIYPNVLSADQVLAHNNARTNQAVIATPLNQVITFDAIDQQNVGSPKTIVPAGVSIVDYKWDFGNGQVGHGPFASTTYNYSKPPPDMQVSLTVTDSHNRMYSCAHRLNLQALTPTYATSLRERG